MSRHPRLPTVENSPMPDRGVEARTRAVGRVVILFSVALFAVALVGCDGDDPTDTVATTSSTERTTTSETAYPSTTPPATPQMGISEAEAQSAAQEAASSIVEEDGVSYAPEDFDVSCDNARGAVSAPTWTCEVDSGQCTGTVEIIAIEDGGTESRNDRIDCGE